jgi:probable HAF family extracellular repeat protein
MKTFLRVRSITVTVLVAAALPIGTAASATGVRYAACKITTAGPTGSSSYNLLINSSGQAAGTASTEISSQAFRWTRARGVRLLTSGADEAVVAAFNDSGTVVFNQYPRWGAGQQHAYLWSPRTGIRDLGTLGGSTSQARALSASGAVVGSAATGTGQAQAFLWTPRTGMRGLGSLRQGGSSEAIAVSPSGRVVVGDAELTPTITHAFVWTRSTGLRDLDPAAVESSVALKVNASGVVTGASWLFGSVTAHVFRWTAAGGMRDLGIEGVPVGIDEYGDITGFTVSDGVTRTFVWSPRGGTRILPVAGQEASPTAMSANGWVAGNTRINGHDVGFRWSSRTGVQYLPALTDGATDALSVNQRGQVAGTVVAADSVHRAVIWTC